MPQPEFTRSDLLHAALAAVRDGAGEVMRIYEDNVERLRSTRSREVSLFEYASQRSDRAIIAALWRYAPEVAIVSERGDDLAFVGEEMLEQPAWFVDPLDGANGFNRSTGAFTIGIGLVERCNPILGVVYAPDRGVLYAGEVECGAVRAAVDWERWCGGDRTLDVLEEAAWLPQNRRYPQRFRLFVPEGRMSGETRAYVEERRSEEPELELDSAPCPIRLCAVAEGTAEEATTLDPSMEWNTAAGDAIARAAGCHVRMWPDGFSLIYNKSAHSNPAFIVTGAGVPVH